MKRAKHETKKADIIISFTSFPARIKNVWMVVECLLRQTVIPRKILLWLSKDQFRTIDEIPPRLRALQNDIFEIQLVEGDIRSHKKYYYACKKYSCDDIILVDDDIFYPSDMIERMLVNRKNKNEVICQYGAIIKYDNIGEPLPYNQWEEYGGFKQDNDFFFGSGGGVLFRPSELYTDLTKIELALKLTPYADDVWLNAMARLNNLKIIKIETGTILPITQGKKNKTLASSNLIGGNDNQIRAVNDYYYKSLGRAVFGLKKHRVTN